MVSLREMKSKSFNDDFSYIAPSDKMQDKIIKSVGGDNYSGFCKLRVFQSQVYSNFYGAVNDFK
jgi:hypothetical protein